MAKIKNNKKTFAAVIFGMLLAVTVAIFYVICSGSKCYMLHRLASLALTPIPTPAPAPTIELTTTNFTLIATTNVSVSASSSMPTKPISFIATLIVICLSVIATCISNVNRKQQSSGDASKQNDDNSEAIVDENDSLYWIYDEKLSGPFNKQKICDMYRAHELHGMISVQNAKSSGEDGRDWFKLYLPPLYPHDLKNLLTKKSKNVNMR
eukprot:1007525_1